MNAVLKPVTESPGFEAGSEGKRTYKKRVGPQIIPEDERMVSRSMSLCHKDMLFLLELGEGNISAGIRKAIAETRKRFGEQCGEDRKEDRPAT